MNQNNVSIAEAYYKTLGSKNLHEVEKYLHPDVQLVAPFAKIAGKKNVLEAAKEFTTLFETLTIRAKFGSENQAMIVYDLECFPPIGIFSAAVLLTLQNGLISRLELFYDTKPLEVKE